MTNKLEAGNWLKFDSFVWFDRPDDAENFAIVHAEHRDSDSITRANARVIGQKLEPFSDDVFPVHFNHWAVGWIDGYAIRVPSKAAEVYEELADQIDDYPILDESVHSEIFLEDCDLAWDSWAKHDFRKELEKTYIDLDISDEVLYNLFLEVSDEIGEYWEEDGSSPYIDVAKIAAEVTRETFESYTK